MNTPVESTAPGPIFPYPRECPFSPPAAYTSFREDGGLHKVDQWSGEQSWLATRYDDVRALLGDNEHFSSDVTLDGFPLPHPDSRVTEAGAVMRKDNPEHDHDRRILTREFSVKRVEALRPRVLEITDELIDDLVQRGQDGPVDLVAHFAHQLPARIICEMMGLAEEDGAAFAEHVLISTDYAADTAEKQRAHQELDALFEQTIAAKRAERQDDIISRLVHDHLDTGDIDLATLKRMLLVLFAGGQDTTANMIGLSVLALCQNPQQLDALRDDPTRAPAAVEELLRFLSVNQGEPRRVAARDGEVGGCPVRKGEAIIASLSAANFDPTVFDRDGSPASTLDLSRGARNHVAFGFGVHQCLGQNLARVELQVALPRLFERIPGLRLALPADALTYRTTAVIFGLAALPVTW